LEKIMGMSGKGLFQGRRTTDFSKFSVEKRASVGYNKNQLIKENDLVTFGGFL